MADIHQWLRDLDLAQYAEVFEANDITLDLLPDLTDQALKDIGVASAGHRIRMLKAIAGLSREPALLPARSTASGKASRPPAAEATKIVSAILGAAESGERRQLTVLFCDLVGFTELASRLDPEVLQAIVRSYEDTCAACVTRYEGYVFQRLGDGIVAFFGYPLAHEGEAERAIRAGLEIIDSLSRLEVPEVGHLQVRVGIATGLVVVSSAEKGAVG